jgi:hypothetical protein
VAAADVLALLRDGQDHYNGTRFAFKIDNADVTEAVADPCGLVAALRDRSLEPLLDPRAPVHIPAFGRCQLAPSKGLVQLKDMCLSQYFVGLFHSVAAFPGPTGLRVSLSRYDLYHAHLVVNRDLDVAALLFHAMEYPQQSPAFPHNLGFCQADSPLVFQPATFPFRNALWVLPLDAPAKASLWLLDAREPSIVWEQLLNPWNRPLYTADEARLGDVVADVYLVGATPLAWYPFNRTPVVQGGMT